MKGLPRHEFTKITSIALLGIVAAIIGWQCRLLTSSTKRIIVRSSIHNRKIDSFPGNLEATTNTSASDQGNTNIGHQDLGTIPLQMLQEYQMWHSHEALLHRNDVLRDQTFVVGLYSCPDSAGNRLHEFFNAMIQAIANNITLFVKFHDQSTCQQVRIQNADIWCTSHNTEELCDELIQRAPWLPLYDDWKNELNLTLGKRGQLSQYLAPITNGNHIWIPNEVVTPVPSRKLVNLNNAGWVKNRFRHLYSMGSDYLYGMLFRKLFPFHPKLVPNPPHINNESFTIALHSRHFNSKCDGKDIDKEVQCLNTILTEHQQQEQPCQVFIMSDRNLTVQALVDHTNQRGCSPVIANQHEEDKGLFAEHGPFALKGFFQDLALVQLAQSAFIGHCEDFSTSSDLVRELIEYNHIAMGYEKGSLPICCIAREKERRQGKRPRPN